jgi:4'-phosphopantetheinyl transferase EntD
MGVAHRPPSGIGDSNTDLARFGPGDVPFLPTLFAGLPVVTEERPLSAPVPHPEVEDREAVARAVEKRRTEYLVGRHCAREALRRVGVRDFVLRAGADRAPIWPTGIVGSITHTGTPTDGFCGVAVARNEDLIAVGLDAELATPLAVDLWPAVLTPRERHLLDRHAPETQALVATLHFSAKESVYKALYPLHPRWIGFHEVELDFDLAGQRFEASVQATSMAPTRLVGRFLVGVRVLVTGVAIAAAAGHESAARSERAS